MARVGKYVVTGELGRGRAGALVSSALDPVIGRQVAVKAVSKAAAEQVARLQREAQAAGVLHHTHIVSIYEYGEDAAQAWLATEMVRGKPLSEHLAAGYRAEAEPPAPLVLELLEALDYVHTSGVCHGDLRAANVLVADSGAVKLIGFGSQGVSDEHSDLRAVIALLRQVFAQPPAALDAPHASVRALLEALKPRKSLGDKMRRALKTVQPEAAAAASARKLPAVLFVDDEERVLNALAGLFQGKYDVDTAASGAAALEKLRGRKYLVLCSDQRMPGMKGVELLREAKALAPASVRLLLTGYSDLNAIVASVNEGEVFRFINKPWQQAELEATLAEAAEVGIALEAARAGGRTAARVAGTVLLAGLDAALARGARELSGGALRVLEAPEAKAALEILAGEEVGVVVAGVQPGGGDPAALLRVLKEASPRTQLVAVAESADSELAIGLINEARIHRFLAQPVSLPALQQAIVSALERYSSMKAAPGLARAERAQKTSNTPMQERMRAFGNRLKSVIGT